jgi:hypothetical protein
MRPRVDKKWRKQQKIVCIKVKQPTVADNFLQD